MKIRHRFLVTSATGDIGKEMCLFLASKNHNLIVTARDLLKLKELSEKIKAEHPSCEIEYFSADLGLPDTMSGLVAASQRLGIDGVVLMPPRPPILPNDFDQQFKILNKVFQDSFTGPRYLLQKLLSCMETSTLKSVILVSGTSSKQPILSSDWEAFNDVRTAWVGCLKTFSNTYGSKGIRFNTVSPGQVMTSTYNKKIEDEAKTQGRFFADVLQEKTKSTPLGKFASVDGVVKTIYFFLKSGGSSEITSANIQIDGGTVQPYY